MCPLRALFAAPGLSVLGLRIELPPGIFWLIGLVAFRRSWSGALLASGLDPSVRLPTAYEAEGALKASATVRFYSSLGLTRLLAVPRASIVVGR